MGLDLSLAIGRGVRNGLTSGSTAAGLSALGGVSNRISCTAFGRRTLQQSAVAASGCSAFGTDALRTNFSGIRNTAIGAGAGNNNYIGGLNVAVGFNALYSNNLGSSHVAVGDSALSNVSGYSYNNTALGTDAGITLVSGSQNTLLGYKADVDASGRNSCVCLGSGTKTPPLDGSFAVGGKESPFIMGNLLSPHAGGNSGQHWIVYLNGTQYRIKLENPPA